MQTHSGLVQLIASTKVRIVKIHLGTDRYRDVWAKEIGEGVLIPSSIEGVPIVEDKGAAEYGISVFYDFNSPARGKDAPTRQSPPETDSSSTVATDTTL